jgi:hypothetical protein
MIHDSLVNKRSAFDEELGYWICTECKLPYDSYCLSCGGLGYYILESGIVECNCCSCNCRNDYVI